MEIIPAIDIIDGRCVRLTQGDFAQKTVYHEDPLPVAQAFEAAGVRRLHLVDLDGARQGRVVNWKVLEKICIHTSLQIDFGGGIKSRQDVDKVLECGARWATIGSMAVKQPDEFSAWIDAYGADRFFLGADVQGENIAVGGWLETTSQNVFDFMDGYTAKGIQYIFCTDISRDGKLEGPSYSLYTRIMDRNPQVKLVASGGVSSIDDLPLLAEAGCAGVIIGKALYEKRITLDQLRSYLT